MPLVIFHVNFIFKSKCSREAQSMSVLLKPRAVMRKCEWAEVGRPAELTWQSLSSWLNLILKVSHQFTHTAGSSLCTSHSEPLSRGSKGSRLVSIINNQGEEIPLIYFENYFIIHKFLNVTA